MKNHEDAFGHALLDYFLGEEAQIIIERDDGNLDVSGEPEMYFREYDQWEEYERIAIAHGSGRILDIRGVREVVLMQAARISSKLGIFDTILMMGNNFGLVANKRRAKWLLRRFHSMTTTEAKIIATTLNPLATTDPCHLDYHERNRQKGRMPGQVRIRARYRNYIGNWFDYLFVTLDEMNSITDETGWYVSKVIESEGPVYAAIIAKKI